MGKWGMGGLNVSEIILPIENNLYNRGNLCIFLPKNAKFVNVCVITWKIHSQSKDGKIQFLKFSHDYT